jgi:hypothetical protein
MLIKFENNIDVIEDSGAALHTGATWHVIAAQHTRQEHVCGSHKEAPLETASNQAAPLQ